MTIQEQLALIVKMAGIDLRFVSLVEALTEKCPGCISRVCPVDGVKEYVRSCCGTGRVLRPWGDLPQGALVIPLLKAAFQEGLISSVTASEVANRCLYIKDANAYVAQVVLGALKDASHV